MDLQQQFREAAATARDLAEVLDPNAEAFVLRYMIDMYSQELRKLGLDPYDRPEAISQRALIRVLYRRLCAEMAAVGEGA